MTERLTDTLAQLVTADSTDAELELIAAAATAVRDQVAALLGVPGGVRARLLAAVTAG
jgi:hypothetical protein